LSKFVKVTAKILSVLFFPDTVYLVAVLQSLIVALVLSRSDYCNNVLFGLIANLIQRLLSVQNAAIRLIIRIGRSEHNYYTPALDSLAARTRAYLIQIDCLDVPYPSVQGTSPSYATYSRVSPATPSVGLTII